MATHISAATPRRTERAPGTASIRFAAVAGALFFALFIVHAQLVTGMPAATDRGREIADWIARHQGRLQLDAAVMGLAMAAALVWLSALVGALRRTAGATSGLAIMALGGGILAATATVVGALIEGATATRIDELSVSAAQFNWTLFLMSIGVTLIGLMLVIGATALTELFARWFMAGSVLLALLSFAGAFTVGYASDAIQTVAGIAIVLDSVWIFVVSVFLWRDPGRALR